MKIMTNKRYAMISDIMRQQNMLILQKENEIKRLKAQVERLGYLLDEQLSADKVLNDLDFPNSHPIIEPNMDDHWRL